MKTVETNLPFITVTGPDEKTDIELLKQLNAEIGLLYASTQKRCNRYPSKEWIRYAIQNLSHVAIHICGPTARKELLSGYLDNILEKVQRIQINGQISIDECQEICEIYSNKTIITQHKLNNEHLLKVKATNHTLLIDSSGGKGISPTIWSRPKTEKKVGYAGGLSAENISLELEYISKIAGSYWWVDMEEKLRVNDYFSIELASKCISDFNTFLNKQYK